MPASARSGPASRPGAAAGAPPPNRGQLPQPHGECSCCTILGAQVGTAWALGALQTLAAVVFSTLTPPQPECVKAEDDACVKALAAGQLCSLPRDAWHWPST